jgi:hypothetical protein
MNITVVHANFLMHGPRTEVLAALVDSAQATKILLPYYAPFAPMDLLKKTYYRRGSYLQLAQLTNNPVAEFFLSAWVNDFMQDADAAAALQLHNMGVKKWVKQGTTYIGR